jgi:two-component system, LytTR family, response regulator
MILSSIIIDDELKSRENLKVLVEDFCTDIQVTALCASVNDAVTAIKSKSVDLVFLDVQMQGESGFDLFDRVKERNFEVIFTTAYAEYAIKAFKFSALDFLLKPIDVEDLRQAVEKVKLKQNNQAGNLSQKVQQFIANMKVTDSENFKLALPTSTGLIFVKVKDILYCEASSNYTTIHLADKKKYLITRTLKDYEDLLQDHNFLRIHNSYLVNMNAVKQYVRGEGGSVTLIDNTSLDVSKRKKEAFLSQLNK